MPQMFADPAEIAAQERAERERQLARERERQGVARREYERVASAQRAWAIRRKELEQALAEARQRLSQAEAGLSAARASGDPAAALEAARDLPALTSLVSLADLDLQAHQRLQP